MPNLACGSGSSRRRRALPIEELARRREGDAQVTGCAKSCYFYMPQTRLCVLQDLAEFPSRNLSEMAFAIDLFVLRCAHEVGKTCSTGIAFSQEEDHSGGGVCRQRKRRHRPTITMTCCRRMCSGHDATGCWRVS